MDSLKQKLMQEINEFRDLGHKFLNKEISVGDFKKISGGMGAYAQRGGEKFMIRVKFPSGIVQPEDLKLVYGYTQKYNIDRVHFTTRETIQLHDLDIDNVCDIMADCIDKNIFTRGGGGNYPRNVSLSPLSGVSKDEVFDPTPYAMLVNEHFLSKITTYHLPRKLKVGFSNSQADTSCTTATDLGFMATEYDGKPFFRMFLGGGIGNNPELGVEYPELVEPRNVLYHVEAMVKFFMEEGDYNNHSKARIRYILKRMGKDDFISEYNKRYEEIKSTMKLKELENPELNKNIDNDYRNDKKILIEQRQSGLYTVILHPANGQLETTHLGRLIEFIDSVDNNLSLRLGMDESLYIRNLKKSKAEELIHISADYRKDIDIERNTCCIGYPVCQMGMGNSQGLFDSLISYLKENNAINEFLPAINISGCLNSCSRHQIAKLGFMGKKKRIEDNTTDLGFKMEDAFEVYAGGKLGLGKTRFGKAYGAMKIDDIKKFVLDLSRELESKKMYFEDFLELNEDKFIQIVNNYI